VPKTQDTLIPDYGIHTVDHNQFLVIVDPTAGVSFVMRSFLVVPGVCGMKACPPSTTSILEASTLIFCSVKSLRFTNGKQVQ
jgi:hypothetical protein